MKVATWNVNGIRARHEQVRAWIEAEAPDVLCLQEIKAMPAQVPASLLELPGYSSYWHGAKGYSGVAMLVRQSFSPEAPVFQHPPFDHESRIVTALIDQVTVASIYVPNGGKDFAAKMRFLRALEEFAGAYAAAGDPLLLCGDMNVAHTPRDVHPKERGEFTGQLPEERAILDEWIGHGLVDVGRVLDPENDALYTWWAPWRQMRQRNIGWRLDYLFCSAPLAARAQSCRVMKDFGTSDHAPVVAVFDGAS